MPDSHLIPVTILTGFLGAGKTTLLNRILKEQHGQRIAVIENEFGETGVDNDLLTQESDEQIIEMNNGCICCNVRGDLIRVLKELRDKRKSGKIKFDRVLIETTGVANPAPVCQTFFMDDEIGEYYLLDGVLTVVDAKHAMQQLDAQSEAREQVAFADRILLSKTDLVDEKTQAALRQRIARMNPRAPMKAVHFGETAIAEILDIRGFNLNAILEISPEFLQAEAHDHAHEHAHEHAHDHEHCDHEHGHCEHPEHAHDQAHEHCDHEHGHCTHDHDDHGHHHGHTHLDDIQSFVFQSDRAFNPMLLEEFMGGLVNVYGEKMMRYKGVLFMDGTERRMLFQGVHMLMGADLGRAWQADEKRYSKLVFIGRDLPKEIFIKGLEQCLV